MAEIRLVLVDFDDTLVDTAPRFHQARLELFRLLSEAGFDLGAAYRVHHDEIEPLMRQRFGFGPRRLEHSFRATYEALCTAAACPVDDDVAARVAGLGHSVAGPPPLLKGALAALQRLNAALPTALYTQAGDVEYQLSCVRASGVLDVIPPQRIVICEHKTAGRFQQVLSQFGIEDPASVWMVGNSMRHDINPALESGAHAIFVAVTNPWEFDVVPPVSEPFRTVATLQAAVDLLLPIQEPQCR
ncbi:MAG: HAD family hydrolase [Gemmatimonadota bacterium]